MPNILILYAHPAAELSRANGLMVEAAAKLPNVVVNDLYERYPDFHIDIERERQLLTQADLVVMQHPIHWYSMPALQKEWLDLVLARDWAFGHDGNALRGKGFWLVASTGGESGAYAPDGRHGHPFSDFLPPYRQTAQLCGMRWMEPLILHGAHNIAPLDFQRHVERYLDQLKRYPALSATDDAPIP
ncbi:NAD(P)H-dependent oxidoreductase [Herbaspirillum sp. SJZ099]|uniref:glutathione-regulated potassium-efflux system oxidoreductase KefF n=1 Tax=Herbaspirillum sp. SJZ099 TaxID=2572916 RepID=UPI00119CBF0B|nr:NAD(P)H-dependent oxidoreductase [Herbaspirillum sp. SJZ099]TWC69654.1 Kef-type potassium/proton antiporter accessory protein (CPA2 family) [Herbaspirillum sp. SJZ099]